ncbi:DNA polymerase III subunit delta [Candidatus Saccharibacteria bacterium]|nr:DNA polymerase III subunit delta [Candidatus Saccharibacteria bacterium]
MITVLSGENTFEITRELERRIAAFDGDIERVDGSEIELRQLPDLLMGATLFSSNRLVIIKGLSSNKSVWNDLVDWLPRIGDDLHVIFVDGKPDKRTKTYKELIKVAKVVDFPIWTDRDIYKAEQWVEDEARKQKLVIDKKSIQTLVARVGVDQWQLHHALEKLAVFDVVSSQLIEDVIEANPSENVFNLLDAALKGNFKQVSDMLQTLRMTDDPYMVFGLLSSQVFQLAALAVSDKPSSEVAKDIGAHPFALQKLAPHATRVGRSGAKRMITAFANADASLKSTTTEPWLLIERALASTMQ